MPTFDLICQKWEESEFNWGTRPDGYSLHFSEADRAKFVQDHFAAMHALSAAPHEYSRPRGTPYRCNVVVTDEQATRMAAKSGVRVFKNDYPEATDGGGKDGWVADLLRSPPQTHEGDWLSESVAMADKTGVMVVAMSEKIGRIAELERYVHLLLGWLTSASGVSLRDAEIVQQVYKGMEVAHGMIHAQQKLKGCVLWESYSMPGDWPKGHMFSDNPLEVTCPDCLQVLVEKHDADDGEQRSGFPTHVVIDEEDKCDCCDTEGRGRFAIAWGAGKPVICLRCLSIAGPVIDRYRQMGLADEQKAT